MRKIGAWMLGLFQTLHGMGAFALITAGVMCTKFNASARVVHPLARDQIAQAGLRQLPVVLFMAVALGFVVIGQMVALLSRVGAQDLAGTVMVTVIVRELGPLTTALLVLARIGTATVIELGTMRARGEIEALEALGIDPVHYLVVPRVVGLALSIFALSAYFVLAALASGYFFLFLQDVPLAPGEYIRQLVAALRWEDFLLLGFKTLMFGAIIAIVTCYEGLAQPLRQDQVSRATARAILYSLNLCVALDVLLILYWLI